MSESNFHAFDKIHDLKSQEKRDNDKYTTNDAQYPDIIGQIRIHTKYDTTKHGYDTLLFFPIYKITSTECTCDYSYKQSTRIHKNTVHNNISFRYHMN